MYLTFVQVRESISKVVKEVGMDEATRAWQEHGTCAGCQSDQHSQFDCPTSPLCPRCGHPHRQEDCTVRIGVVRGGKQYRQAKRKAEEDAELERQEKRIALREREMAVEERELELRARRARLESSAPAPSTPSTFTPSLGQQTRQPLPPFWNPPRSRNPPPPVRASVRRASPLRPPPSISDDFPPLPSRKAQSPKESLSWADEVEEAAAAGGSQPLDDPLVTALFNFKKGPGLETSQWAKGEGMKIKGLASKPKSEVSDMQNLSLVDGY